jgi:hypothetical protein
VGGVLTLDRERGAQSSDLRRVRVAVRTHSSHTFWSNSGPVHDRQKNGQASEAFAAAREQKTVAANYIYRTPNHQDDTHFTYTMHHFEKFDDLFSHGTSTRER